MISARGLLWLHNNGQGNCYNEYALSMEYLHDSLVFVFLVLCNRKGKYLNQINGGADRAGTVGDSNGTKQDSRTVVLAKQVFHGTPDCLKAYCCAMSILKPLAIPQWRTCIILLFPQQHDVTDLNPFL
jgi:hypothetical protein